MKLKFFQIYFGKMPISDDVDYEIVSPGKIIKSGTLSNTLPLPNFP